ETDLIDIWIIKVRNTGLHELIEKTKELQSSAWKKSLSEISIHSLQERLDKRMDIILFQILAM
ncbi:hypothetical protein ACWF7H_29530, partial [Peribacillus butanolivorans]